MPWAAAAARMRRSMQATSAGGTESLRLVMDVAPGSVDVLRRIDGVLVVDGVGEIHVAVLADTFLWVDTLTRLNRQTTTSMAGILLCCIESQPRRRDT